MAKEKKNNEEFSEEWQNGKVTISRREYGEAVGKEMLEIYAALLSAHYSKEQVDFIRELLLSFAAGIGASIFPEDTSEDKEG